MSESLSNRPSLPLRLMLLLNISLYAFLFHQWAGVATILILFLLSFFPIQIDVDRIGQMIIALISLVAAYVFAVGIGPAPTNPISNSFALVQAFLCIWILLICCGRFFYADPAFGHRATVFWGLGALFACGGFKIGYVFHVAVVLFSILALWAMVDADPSRPLLSEATPKRKKLLVFSVILTSLMSGALVLSLPPAYQWASQQLGINWIHRRQSGFDRYFRLGSLNQMIQSNKVTLRVWGRGRSTLYLRGLVYNRYINKYWLIPKRSPLKLLSVPAKKKQTADRLLIEYVAGESNHYFVPMGADDFAVPERVIRVTRTGLVLPMQDKDIHEASFSLKQGQKGLSIAPPEKVALEVPNRLYKPIKKLAVAWTKGATTPLSKMIMLKRYLGNYRYSLSFKRPKKKEPLLDFLFHNKQGHCEYFASSLALLARAVGVPTRVIGGYLVSEYNKLGGYHIVRERNAHAWVEAWLPKKGWVTFDATPPSGLADQMPKNTKTFSALTDLISVYLKRFRSWLLGLTILEQILGIGLFVLLWVLIRVLRYFRQKKQNISVQNNLYRDPNHLFLALLAFLEPMIPQQDNETIEHYASRLADNSLPYFVHEAAPVLRKYAAFRYGAVGEQSEVEAVMKEWLERAEKERV